MLDGFTDEEIWPVAQRLYEQSGVEDAVGNWYRAINLLREQALLAGPTNDEQVYEQEFPQEG